MWTYRRWTILRKRLLPAGQAVMGNQTPDPLVWRIMPRIYRRWLLATIFNHVIDVLLFCKSLSIVIDKLPSIAPSFLLHHTQLFFILHSVTFYFLLKSPRIYHTIFRILSVSSSMYKDNDWSFWDTLAHSQATRHPAISQLSHRYIRICVPAR